MDRNSKESKKRFVTRSDHIFKLVTFTINKINYSIQCYCKLKIFNFIYCFLHFKIDKIFSKLLN